MSLIIVRIDPNESPPRVPQKAMETVIAEWLDKKLREAHAIYILS